MAQQTDTFFTTNSCDRCHKTPLSIRTTSWFTTETLCIACADKESDLRQQMRQAGMDPSDYEGCGHVPTIAKGEA